MGAELVVDMEIGAEVVDIEEAADVKVAVDD